MFDFILNPLKWVIDQFFSMTGSYVAAIALYTVFIKLIILPLDIKQRKSMRAMAKVQPKIDALNKRYANDPDKKAQKTMELMKKEKVSMFSSCLPMLLQFPIMIAMITVMNKLSYDGMMQMFLDVYNGVGFKLERFIWVFNIFQPDNLSAPILASADTLYAQLSRASSSIITPESIELLKNNYNAVMAPYLEQYANLVNGLGILPVSAAALQFLQTKLTPQQGGEQNKNQKMFTYMMPVMTLFIGWTFSAAFAFYWVVSSILSIIQTIIFNRYFKRRDANEASEGVIVS